MHNYEHEINQTDNKAINAFLWSDYFHDSKITEYYFSRKDHSVTIKLICDREICGIYEKYARKVARAYIKEHEEDFAYTLTFTQVAHFSMTTESIFPKYVNGRFKNSAKLKQLDVNNDLFNLRVQLDSGFMDIIFKVFKICKMVGAVRYPQYSEWDEASSIDEIKYREGTLN